MADVLIDLGDLDREERPPAEPVRPWRRPSRPKVRVAVAVAFLAFVALLIGPATVPLPARFSGPARVPGSGADEFFLAGDLVLVHSGNDRVFRAYGLDGSLRWATAVPFVRAGPITEAGDVMLVSSPMWPDKVGALDLATGEVRWTLDGVLNAVADDVVVLGRGPVELETNTRIRDLTGIDAATGRELWHEVIPPLAIGERLLTVYRGTGLAARARVRADGTADLLDLKTGKWSTITGVPPAPPAPGFPAQTGTAAGYQLGLRAGDMTLVFAVGAEPQEGAVNISEPGILVAYGPDAPEPRWTRKTATWAPALPCGRWICLADGAQTQVLDPATGTEVRRVGWPHVLSGNDRRFLGHTDAINALQVAVYDAGTGRPLHRYPGWNLVSQRYADWTPIVRRDGGLTWQLATLSMDTGAAYPLGTFEAAGERSCQSSATHVACSVRSGEILIWRVVPSR